MKFQAFPHLYGSCASLVLLTSQLLRSIAGGSALVSLSTCHMELISLRASGALKLISDSVDFGAPKASAAFTLAQDEERSDDITGGAYSLTRVSYFAASHKTGAHRKTDNRNFCLFN